MDAVNSQSDINLSENVWFWQLIIGLEIAFISIASLLGHSVFSNVLGILIIALVLSLMSGNVKLFLKDWTLYLLGLSIFNLLRGTVYDTVLLFHMPVHAEYVIKMEHFLTHGHILPHVLQTWWNLSWPLQWMNIQFTTLYVAHF